MQHIFKLTPLTLLAVSLALTSPASAFCGFFVAKAGGDLFNESSKVVMARKGALTTLTMANDFKGAAEDFAIVVPVPVVPKQSQIRVFDNALIEALDAYSAPRLVEYHDRDPCEPIPMPSATVMKSEGATRELAPQSLGVTIEAQYTVGEYDILILSAEQSSGLLTWLNQEGYNLPDGAEKILGSYIKQGLKFFVARVNLAEKEKAGYEYLRPLQMEFATDRFMLPIRLGTLNARAPQDLILITLTEKGRVEAANYPTLKIPSNVNVPLFVQEEFPRFYRDLFASQAERNDLGAVFLEYAWDLGWCDPCASDPPAVEDLKSLGVWWTTKLNKVFITRLHARYTAESFPEDLILHETADRDNFQGRYVTRHIWNGKPNQCEAAKDYFAQLPGRLQGEAETLARLTGWRRDEIDAKIDWPDGLSRPRPAPEPETPGDQGRTEDQDPDPRVIQFKRNRDAAPADRSQPKLYTPSTGN